jgi:H+/Cl- antiporter ClcA
LVSITGRCRARAATLPVVDIADVVRRPQYLVLLAMGLLIGLPAALLSLVFIALVRAATDLVWVTLPEHLGTDGPPVWMLLVVPTVGGVLAALLGRLPGNGGHPASEGLAIAVTPVRNLGSILGAALATLVAGAVLGPEAPVLALGGAVGGLALVRRARQQSGEQSDQVQLILTVAGVAGAMSALFGSPLAAAVFVLEALPLGGAQAMAVMLPALSSAAGGWVLFTGLGSWTGIAAPTLTLGTLPASGPPKFGDYIGVVVVALVAGVVVTLLKRGAHRMTTADLPAPAPVVGLLAGLAVGLCAWIYSAASGQSPTMVLFSGQSNLPELAASGAALGVGTLLLLLVTKGIAYAVCMGSPFRGGPIFPALFVGAVVGALGSALVPGLTALPLFGAGIAAAAAAAMRLPLSATVLVAVLFGQAAIPNLSSILIAAVIGVVVSGLLARAGAAAADSEATAAAAAP